MSTTQPHARKLNAATRRAPWILLAPFLVLFALTFVLPILTAVGSSFTRVTRAGLFGEEGVTSGFAGFANYAQALGDGNFIASIGRMLLFGVVQVPVMIVLATILALLGRIEATQDDMSRLMRSVVQPRAKP